MNTLLAPVFLYLIFGFIIMIIIAIAMRNAAKETGNGIAGIMCGVFSLGVTLILIFVAPHDPRYLSDQSYTIGITAFVLLVAILFLLAGWYATLKSLFAGAAKYGYISLALNFSLTILYMILGFYYYPG